MKNFNYIISTKTLNVWKALNNMVNKNHNINIKKIPVFYVNNYGIIAPKLNYYKFNNVNLNISLEKQNIDKSPNVVQNLSGLYSPPAVFYNDLAMSQYIIKLSLKFVYCMFSGSPLKDKNDVILRLELFLKSDSILKSDLYYPIAQHIITSIMPHFKFDPEILEHITNYMVNYNYYKNDFVSTMPIIEAFVFQNSLGSFIQENRLLLNIIAQNPENPKSDHILYENKTYEQTGQKCADFRFFCENSNNKMWFYDVKLTTNPLITLSLTRGYLSLSSSMTLEDEYKLLVRFRGDLSRQLRKSLDNVTMTELEKASNIMTSIIENKQTQKKDKILKCNKMRDSIDMNPKVNGFACSRIVHIPDNVIFEQFFINEYHKMESELLVIGSNTNLELLVPKKDQIAHVDQWHNLMFKIIKVMPSNIQQDCLENYHKFKLLEYDHI